MPPEVRERGASLQMGECNVAVLVFRCEKFVVYIHRIRRMTTVVPSFTEAKQRAIVTLFVQFAITVDSSVALSL